MRRYTAELDLRVNNRDYWSVRADDLSDSRMDYLTGAEANIIAFALNAVAQGRTLAYSDCNAEHWWQIYEGPTEGVAPDDAKHPQPEVAVA